MQANNSTTNPTGFSWYTGAVNGQPAPVSSTPAPLTSVPITNASSGSEHHPPLPVQMIDIPNDGRTININAQNVYIEENGHHIRADNGSQPLTIKDGELHSNVQKLHINDENKEVPLTVGVHDPAHTSSSSTTTPTTLPTSAPTSSSSKSAAPSNNNPLGIPAPSATIGDHPPSQTGQSTSTSSTDPKHTSTAPLDAHNNNVVANGKPGPDGLVTPSTAPSATTTLKDGIHDTPLSTGTASDKFDTKPPLSTSSTSSTLPANSDHPAEPKKKKEHKGIKEKFHDWKAHRKGGGENPAGSVHPKDSRDGKVLPSEDELSAKYMNSLGGEPAATAKNGLPKDKLDTTGQSVTGSSANPSSKTNPFHAPEVPMRQAPVEAKHA